MPLKIDKLVSNTVEAVQIVQVRKPKPNDISQLYPNSDAMSSCVYCGKDEMSLVGSDIYSIKSQLSMRETTEDFYAVPLGVVNCASMPKVTKVCGTFENVQTMVGVESAAYAYNALVQDASNTGSTYTIDSASVTLVQVSPTEYIPFANFYTPNGGDNFTAEVTLEVQLSSDDEITFSTIE